MKKLFLTILYLSALSLISCEKSNEEKAKEAVYIYLNQNLDDMSSYESVKFGTLDSVDKTKNTVQSNWDFQIFHSYRIKDNEGHKVLEKEYFILISNL